MTIGTSAATEDDLWQLAATTLSALRARGLTPDPRSYHVWFLVEAHQDTGLLQALKTAERKGAPIDAAFVSHLYKRFVEAAVAADILNQNAGHLRDVVDGTEKSLKTNMVGVDHFSTVLSSAWTKLDETLPADALSRLTTDLRAETDTIRQLNARLLDQFDQYKQQVASLQEELSIARRDASTDTLTGSANRKRFDTFLEGLLSGDTSGCMPLSLMMIDVDSFKSINDRFGHRTGDSVLKLVADRLHNNTKGRDLVARYGGDEFAVVLPSTSQTDALSLADDIRKRVRGSSPRHEASGAIINLTISIGVAQWENGDTSSDLIGRADDALYKAKRGGRNMVKAASSR